MFYALADFSAIGFTPYGMDAGPGTNVPPEFTGIAAGFRLLKPAMPVIAELQGTDKLKAAVEEDAISGRMSVFRRYDILVRFRPPVRNAAPAAAPTVRWLPQAGCWSRQLGPDEFLLAGFDAAVDFKPPMGSEFTRAQCLLVEEGTYENGVWKRTYLRNGNFSIGGVTLSPKGAMLKVKLMKY